MQEKNNVVPEILENPYIINVEDQQSKIHLGSLDSFDITKGGTKCAKYILSYLANNKKKSNLEKAIETYESIIPNENFGGEYTALEWLCRLWLSDEAVREDMLSQPVVKSFYDVLCDNDFENLKTYLTYKYHIKEYDKLEDTDLTKQMRFLEDFILFNNPDRERWESTRENMERLDLKEGMSVADVGCGPGYYTFKFADIVGPNGKVYAIENNPKHLDYLHDYVKTTDAHNVEVVESSFEGIGLDPEIKVDNVFVCSLYHNVYAAFTDEEREEFVGSIRNALRDGGKLIIVDNDLVTGTDLPYHGPYISKDLIISQITHYGFILKDTYQFTPQRYVLVFEITDVPTKKPQKPADLKDNQIFVDSSKSLARYRIIGTSTSGYTARGKKWGRIMYDGFINNDIDKLKTAYDGFNDLWPKERIGDDYTAFMWFIEYKLADENKRAEMTEDKNVKFYADYFCGNDFERLKTYLFYKFHLELPDPVDASDDVNFEYTGSDFSIKTLNKYNEFMIFNNPNRKLWEKTDEMCEFFDIKEGESVADIGCGGGFFTWYFSKVVGSGGKVYCTELNKEALEFVDNFVEEYNIDNIESVLTKMNEAGLPDSSVDTIFMCSMYTATYITDIEFVKDSFISTIHKALKKGGRLIIVDNDVTEPGVPSYYGPGTCPDLFIQQLKHYGFILEDRFQVIPQRYALRFREDENYVEPPHGGKDEQGKDKRSNKKSLFKQKSKRIKPSEDPQLRPGQEPNMFIGRKGN